MLLSEIKRHRCAQTRLKRSLVNIDHHRKIGRNHLNKAVRQGRESQGFEPICAISNSCMEEQKNYLGGTQTGITRSKNSTDPRVHARRTNMPSPSRSNRIEFRERMAPSNIPIEVLPSRHKSTTGWHQNHHPMNHESIQARASVKLTKAFPESCRPLGQNSN